MPRAYPDEFRVRAVSLIRAGQTVKKTASDLDVSCAILHRWVKQDKIDRGEIPGVPLADVGQGGRDAGEVELVGLVLGEGEQHGLEVGDLPADRGGVEGVPVGDELGGLAWGEDLGGEEPVQRGGGLVVDAGAIAVAVTAEVDRLLGRCQIVEAVVDQHPEPVQRGTFLGGVVPVVEAVFADEVVVLRLDGGLVVLLVGPGPGEEDLQVRGPRDDGLVEELAAVVEVQSGDLERHLLHAGLQRAEDVDVSVVAHGAGEHPPGVDVGEVQGAGELALQDRAAVRDSVALEEPRLGLDLVAGPADPDRGPQQRRRLRGRHAPDLVGGLRALQVPVDRRPAHREQLGAHGRAVAVLAEDEFAVTLQAVQLRAHRRRKVLPTLPARRRPDPLQRLHRVVGVLRRPGLARPGRDGPTRAWRAFRGIDQPAAGVVPRPARDPDHLIQDPALVRLAGPRVRLRIPGRDLGS